MTKRATVREGSDAKSRMLGTVEVGRVVEALEERHVFFKGAPPPRHEMHVSALAALFELRHRGIAAYLGPRGR